MREVGYWEERGGGSGVVRVWGGRGKKGGASGVVGVEGVQEVGW